MNAIEERVIHAAIDCFASFGIRKTTMEDIAKRSNLSKVTLYKHYKDKQDLGSTVGKDILARYAMRLNNIVVSKEPAISKLCLCLEVVSDFENSNLLSLCKELASYYQTINTALAAYMDTYQMTVCKLIDDGKQAMLIRMDIENEMLFHYIDMGVSYYQNNQDYRNRMIHDPDYRNQFLRLLIGGISADADQLIRKGGCEE